MGPASEDEVEEVLARARDVGRAGRHAESVELLRRAVARFPDHPELLVRVAVAVARTAPAESQEYARRAVRVAPDDPAVLFRCASLMFSHGRFDESRRYAKRARAFADQDFPLLVDLIHLAGKLAAQKGNHADAEKALRIAFEEDPSGIGHGRELAEFYFRRGRLEEAAAVAEEALCHQPDDAALRELALSIATQAGNGNPG